MFPSATILGAQSLTSSGSRGRFRRKVVNYTHVELSISQTIFSASGGFASCERYSDFGSSRELRPVYSDLDIVRCSAYTFSYLPEEEENQNSSRFDSIFPMQKIKKMKMKLMPGLWRSVWMDTSLTTPPTNQPWSQSTT